MTAPPPTQTFPLRVLLTVTTGYLLTEGKADRDNGIGDLYTILGWMTNDSPMTHQLTRFGEECKPWLLQWFPDLALYSQQASLSSLDRWLKTCRPGHAAEGIKMWLAEMKMMFPHIPDSYDVPRIPKGDHTIKSPAAELAEMLGGDTSKIIVIEHLPATTANHSQHR